MIAIVVLVVVATAFVVGMLAGMLATHAALRNRDRRLRREHQRVYSGTSRRAGEARPADEP